MPDSIRARPAKGAENVKVYIVILNWNGWRDTIECLESVFRLSFTNYTVVVCDNGSSDESIGRIRNWADGNLEAQVGNPLLKDFVTPPVPKPILCTQHQDLESALASSSSAPLVLIRVDSNLGFAAGMNIGLRYALSRRDCDFAWLLNNDTVVHPQALSALIERMRRSPKTGMCGSTLLYYGEPEKIQALGGAKYNRWFARGRQIARFASAVTLPEGEKVEQGLAYVLGASMLVSVDFLKAVGLMNESFFLYFEEIDWATRAKDQFELAYSPKSIVYHKEGASSGSNGLMCTQSALSQFHVTRGRILFTRCYYSSALFSVTLSVLASALHRLLKGNFGNSLALLRGAWSGAVYDRFSKGFPPHVRTGDRTEGAWDRAAPAINRDCDSRI